MSKYLLGNIVTLIVFLSLTIPVCAADSGAGTLRNKDTVQLTKGLTYSELVYADDDSHQVGFSLERANDSSVYPIYMACDTIWGGMTLTECVAYAESLGYQVVAGINTDFFNYPGVPIGTVVENGKLRSGNLGANTFAILENGGYYASRHPEITMQLSGNRLPDGGYAIKRLNKLFSNDDLNLYTSDYSTISTRVTEDTWAVRMRITDGNIALGDSVTLVVEEVLPEVQDVPIGEGYVVLTGGREGMYADAINQFAVGDELQLAFTSSDNVLEEAKYASGCGDVIISEGRINDAEGWSPFVGGAHPRTLLGWKSDNTLVLYVADGRSTGYANGLTLRMAAEELLRMGCVYAVNLDGGGSSAMGVLMPGTEQVTIVNQPSDGGLRRGAGYLLFVTDEPCDGAAKNLHIAENNRTVVVGQRVALTPYATDGGLLPAQVPESITYTSEQGKMDGTSYTAPMQACTDIITMSSDGASGQGKLKVVSALDEIKITDNDKHAPDKIVVPVGSSPDLDLEVIYHGVPLAADWTAARYSSDVPLGYAGSDGRFVADGIPGVSGALVITVGNCTYPLEVELAKPLPNSVAFLNKTAIEFHRQCPDFEVNIAP